MIRIKKIKSILTLLIVLMGLSGCSIKISPDELLRPPRLFDEDEKINTMIEESLPEGAKLENINSTEGLSAVKKFDINGDDTEEIMVFYSKEDDESLHVMVFGESGGAYEISTEISVPGKFFEGVVLRDITGDDKNEIIINTSEKRVRSGSYKMSIYEYSKDADKLFEIDYNKYLLYDMNRDGKSDILILNQEERAISLDYYSYNETSEQVEFINETLLDNGDVSKISALETEEGEVKVMLEFDSQGEDERSVFLTLNDDGILQSEEE